MIYAIQAGEGGPIKFGIASRPEGRLRELQTGNPHKLKLLTAVGLAEDKEELIHYHLRKDRLSGEWFRPSIDAWNIVWALERQSIYPEDHEVTNHIVDHDAEAHRWFRARCGFADVVNEHEVALPEVLPEPAVAPFDRTAYQREYMRKRRAK